MRKGFTLIESLAVVAIIGILMSIGTVVFLQARRQASDVKRKNDLFGLSQGFEARYLDRTCPNQTDVNKYPGRSTNPSGLGSWVNVAKLATTSDCANFSTYLSTVPRDTDSNRHYYFNLSQAVGQEAAHYRLMARLDSGGLGADECARQSSVWTGTFLGQAYDCLTHAVIDPGGDYNYYVGR